MNLPGLNIGVKIEFSAQSTYPFEKCGNSGRFSDLNDQRLVRHGILKYKTLGTIIFRAPKSCPYPLHGSSKPEENSREPFQCAHPFSHYEEGLGHTDGEKLAVIL